MLARYEVLYHSKYKTIHRFGGETPNPSWQWHWLYDTLLNPGVMRTHTYLYILYYIDDAGVVRRYTFIPVYTSYYHVEVYRKDAEKSDTPGRGWVYSLAWRTASRGLLTGLAAVLVVIIDKSHRYYYFGGWSWPMSLPTAVVVGTPDRVHYFGQVPTCARLSLTSTATGDEYLWPEDNKLCLCDITIVRPKSNYNNRRIDRRIPHVNLKIVILLP